MNKSIIEKATSVRIFEIVCSPVVDTPINLPSDRFSVLVVADSSSEATRKAVTFFRNLFPENGVKSIEVESFNCVTKGKVILV